ncbi:MAG: TIGR02147 family protein [Pseudobdellovibrionaceae bacterium]
MNDAKPVLKSIFEYDHYRNYLRDFYFYSKATNKRFSYRYFARIGGFKSGNVLKVLIDGKVNLSLNSIEKFCKALKFNKEESLFFKNLVLFNQATSTEEKEIHSKELLRSRSYRKVKPLSEFQHRYLETWYFPVIRGLVGLPGFREDLEWIAQTVSPPITAKEVEQALNELQALGLLSRDENGNLTQSEANLGAFDAIASSAMAKFHREMMKRASESIDRFPRERRELFTYTMGISSDGIQRIKELAVQFRKDIIEVAEKSPDQNSLLQLNVHLFPVTEILATEADESEEKDKEVNEGKLK